MTLRLEKFDSIDAVPAGHWETAVANPHDMFMSRGFVRAVELSMQADTRFRHVVFYDENREPVGCACLSTYRVDGSLLAEGASRSVVKIIGSVLPFLVFVNVALCGLPVSAGQSHLRLSPDVDVPEALRLLDEALRQLARDHRAKVIVCKEFSATETTRFQPLEGLGYRRADSLPMNCTDPQFGSFDEYLASLKSKRRSPITRSQKKFAASGMTVRQLWGGEGVDESYTDEVHGLYESVFNRAEVKFERLPPEFFRQLARQLPDNSRFTFVEHGGRVTAFAASLYSPESYHQMFVGVNHQLNSECDLYFNLFFHAIDAAFRSGSAEIQVGQSADDFKHQKFSCFQKPLSLYIKGARPIERFMIRRLFSVFFPPREIRK